MFDRKNIGLFLFISCLVLNAQKPYRGAEYRTIETFLYGRFEVRMKSALGSGIVSSFFTIRDYWGEGLSNPQYWREIDFEALGNHTDKFQTNIITQYEQHHEILHTLLYNPHVGFHTYVFEWTPEYIDFYIDGQLVRHDGNPYVGTLDTYQKIMMNIWQPIWEDWVGEFDEDILPIYAFYDWVKYYSYTPGTGDYGLDNNFSHEWTDEFDYFDQGKWQKATHTWSSNNAQFVQENAVIQNGYLILCLTDNISSGYSGEPLSISSNQRNIYNENIITFPNPFNSNFTLKLPADIIYNIKKVDVYDINGKKVLSTNLLGNENYISLSFEDRQLASGIYYGILSAKNKDHVFKITFLE